jgi:hypothetical protein
MKRDRTRQMPTFSSIEGAGCTLVTGLSETQGTSVACHTVYPCSPLDLKSLGAKLIISIRAEAVVAPKTLPPYSPVRRVRKAQQITLTPIS